jgi:hypothetical protein
MILLQKITNPFLIQVDPILSVWQKLYQINLICFLLIMMPSQL